jgi:hypothetical protein
MTDLVGRTTRGIFRDLTTDGTVGAIATAFQDEGFAPNPDCMAAANAAGPPPDGSCPTGSA